MKTIIFTGLALTILTLAGCSEENSFSPLATEAAVIDTAPPAVPTGLAAAASTSVIKLAWDSNTVNTDLKGFLVYRLAFENAYLLTPVPVGETTFVDRQPLGIPCSYAVSSVDESGNESAWQEVKYTGNPENPDQPSRLASRNEI